MARLRRLSTKTGTSITSIPDKIQMLHRWHCTRSLAGWTCRWSIEEMLPQVTARKISEPDTAYSRSPHHSQRLSKELFHQPSKSRCNPLHTSTSPRLGRTRQLVNLTPHNPGCYCSRNASQKSRFIDPKPVTVDEIQMLHRWHCTRSLAGWTCGWSIEEKLSQVMGSQISAPDTTHSRWPQHSQRLSKESFHQPSKNTV